MKVWFLKVLKYWHYNHPISITFELGVFQKDFYFPILWKSFFQFCICCFFLVFFHRYSTYLWWANDFQTKSMLALNKKLKFPIHFQFFILVPKHFWSERQLHMIRPLINVWVSKLLLKDNENNYQLVSCSLKN